MPEYTIETSNRAALDLAFKLVREAEELEPFDPTDMRPHKLQEVVDKLEIALGLFRPILREKNENS